MIYTQNLTDMRVISIWKTQDTHIEPRTVIPGEVDMSQDFKFTGIGEEITGAVLIVNVSAMSMFPDIPMASQYIRISKGNRSQTYYLGHDASGALTETGNITIDFSDVITESGTYTLTVHQEEEAGTLVSDFVPEDYMILINKAGVVGLNNKMMLTNMKVVVTTEGDSAIIDPGGDVEPTVPIDTQIVADAICLFEQNTTKFTGNGMAILHPISCVVKETAGSDYSLSMEFPLSDERWTLLKPGRLIRVPVPVVDTPQFELADSSFWRVKTACSVYENPSINYTSYKTVETQNANLNTTVEGNKTGTTNTISSASYGKQDVTLGNGRVVTDVEEYEQDTTYAPGDYVTWDGVAYQALNYWTDVGDESGLYPSPASKGGSGAWAEVGKAQHVYDTSERTSTPASSPKVVSYTVPTKTLIDLPVGTIVTLISIVNTFWVQIRVRRDNQMVIGYVKAEWLEYSEDDTTDNLIASRHITHQAFRIKSVSVDTDSKVANVEARHKTYDMEKSMLSACLLESVSPAVAIAVIQTSQLGINDKRLIATNISESRDEPLDPRDRAFGDEQNMITGDWSWDNALAAYIDSDNGVVAQLQARLVRDYDDMFLLENTIAEVPSFTFSAGTNLVGVSWTIDDSEVITRIIPTYDSEAGDARLLPEVFIDAENINDFSEPRCEVLETGYKLGEYAIMYGQSVMLADPSTPLTHQQNLGPKLINGNTVYGLVRRKAKNRFDRDHVNLVKHIIDIDFTMLGDTLEYAPIKALGEARLYDTVRVKIPEIGLDINTQVDGYEWDCTNPRKPFMRSISLSDAYRKSDWPVSGMRIKSGSVKYDKLSISAKKEINKNISVAVTKGLNKAIKVSKNYTDSRT